MWGKSGHVQTVLYGKMGRVSSPQLCGMRLFLPMHDGATATFDLFEPLGDHVTGGKFIHLNRIKCYTIQIFWKITY